MTSSPNAIFNISNVSVTDFTIFTQNFTQIRCSWKTLIFLSRENRQTRQTCDHIKKHSTMTKQDRAVRFSRRSSSNSLLESSTCRAPLGQSNGRLFWTFGNFPDSPYISRGGNSALKYDIGARHGPWVNPNFVTIKRPAQPQQSSLTCPGRPPIPSNTHKTEDFAVRDWPVYAMAW
jgi:hypothetical protein